jgi:chromosome segregation ATPase
VQAHREQLQQRRALVVSLAAKHGEPGFAQPSDATAEQFESVMDARVAAARRTLQEVQAANEQQLQQLQLQVDNVKMELTRARESARHSAAQLTQLDGKIAAAEVQAATLSATLSGVTLDDLAMNIAACEQDLAEAQARLDGSDFDAALKAKAQEKRVLQDQVIANKCVRTRGFFRVKYKY